MPNIKRIFLIAHFKDESVQSIRVERRHWLKGFVRIGHDVQRFNYRNIMIQSSPLKTKTIIRFFGKKVADNILIEQIKHYYPDIVFVLSMEGLNADTVRGMRKFAPNAVFVGRDGDWYPAKNKERMKIAKEMDIVIATNAGEWLMDYKKAGVRTCAFLPCPCDPDIQHPYEFDNRLKSDIIFTGKAEHSKHKDKSDPDRYAIVKKISDMPNAKVYGAIDNPKIEGIDIFRAISNAKIALSINAVNNIRMYHSDRLVNCLSCGTFVLAKRVPDSDLLFKDGVHLRYFDNAEEFFELADWYIKHDDERLKIAEAGMKRAHSEFSCEKIAQHLMDLIETGDYDAPWKTIL